MSNKKPNKAPRESIDPANLIARAPSERWQRHTEGRDEPRAPDDRRPVQRADSGLQQLARSRQIGLSLVVAATRWRSDYELGVHGARDPDKSGSGGGVDGYSIARVDALTRHHKAAAAVGRFGTSLLIAFVVESLSLNSIAADLDARRQRAIDAGRDTGGMWSRQDLTGAVVATLARLGEHYSEIDDARGKLPAYEFSRLLSERRRA